jgi:hypothetical protein
VDDPPNPLLTSRLGETFLQSFFFGIVQSFFFGVVIQIVQSFFFGVVIQIVPAMQFVLQNCSTLYKERALQKRNQRVFYQPVYIEKPWPSLLQFSPFPAEINVEIQNVENAIQNILEEC